MTEKLKEAMIERAESMDWIWHNCTDGSIELESRSPAGKNLIVSLCGKDVIREMRQYTNDFEPDEHAEMWVENRGKRSVPDSIGILIDDADEIQKMLEVLADELESLESSFDVKEEIDVSESEGVPGLRSVLRDESPHRTGRGSGPRVSDLWDDPRGSELVQAR